MTKKRKRKDRSRGARRSAQANARARDQLRTIKAKASFLRVFAQCGNVLKSAQAVKIGRRTVYDWLEDDEAFKRIYDDAKEDAADLLVEEARRRAHDGVLEPVYQGGMRVGMIRKYSDTLLITLLKGVRPETFRERFEHSGPGGGPIETRMIDQARVSLEGKLDKLGLRLAAPTAAAGR